jgi:hypothetical protein
MMAERFLKTTVYATGRRFDGGTPESEIDKEYLDVMGDHLWTDEDPRVTSGTGESDPAGLVATLQSALANRDADNAELRAEVDSLRSQANLSADLSAQVSTLEEERTKLAEERDALQVQVDELRAAAASADAGNPPVPDGAEEVANTGSTVEPLPDNLGELKRAELVELAKARGIDVPSSANKEDIVAALQA